MRRSRVHGRRRRRRQDTRAGTGALHAGERTLDGPWQPTRHCATELLGHGRPRRARLGDDPAARGTASGSGRSSTTTRCGPGGGWSATTARRRRGSSRSTAIEDPGLQKRCLEALEVAVGVRRRRPRALRVPRSTGCAWPTGSTSSTARSSCIGADGELEPWPVDDPARSTDGARRLGLPPFAEHAADDARAVAQAARRRRADQPDMNASSTARQQYHAATRAVGAERLAERLEHRGAGGARQVVQTARSPCARRGRRPATRRAGRAGTSGTSPRSSGRSRAPSVSCAHDLVVGEAPDAIEHDRRPRARARRDRGSMRPCRPRGPPPAALRPASASTPSGVGSPSKSGFEASVDRARRRTRELLVADRTRELGEVRAARAAAPEVAGPGRVDDRRRTPGTASARSALASTSSRRAIGAHRNRERSDH